jgi:DNA polymerase I-like protein with 3'-5' exonuclease and polymerase domains/uracil-DNA glycosylase
MWMMIFSMGSLDSPNQNLMGTTMSLNEVLQPAAYRPRSSGPESARLVIVMEHLTAADLKAGEPCSGPSGAIIDLALQNAMIPRSDVYFTSLIKEYITTPQMSKYYYEKGRNRDKRGYFTPAGEKHKASLIAELMRLRPTVVVACGSATINALTGKAGQMKHRGSCYLNVFTESGLPKVVCTLNPGISVFGSKKQAAAIEGTTEVSPYVFRYYIANDIKTAKRNLSKAELLTLKRELITEPNLSTVLGFIKLAKKVPVIGVDIEVTNHQVSLLGIAVNKALCISIPFDTSWDPLEEIQIWDAVADLLGDPNIEKVGQNFLFDTWFLARQNKIITRGRLQDTMIAQHVMYPDMHKGLDFITSVYTDEPYYKDEGKIWDKVGITHEDIMAFRVYNAKDAAVTLESWVEHLRSNIKKMGFQSTYDKTIALMGVALYWQLHGLLVDKDRLDKVRIETNQRIGEMQSRLEELVGEPLNVNSPAQVKEYFYDRLGIPPYYKTSKSVTGEMKKVPTVDDKAMARLARGTAARPALEEASIIQQIRGLRKLQGTYLEMTIDPDSRIRCSVNLRGTVTGRLSTSKTIPFGTGMNFQNLPPAFKSFIIPDEGHFFIEVDLRQAEWVASAYIFDDPAMQLVVEQGLDPHAATFCMMAKLDFSYISAVKAEDALIGHTTDAEEIAQIRKTVDDPLIIELYKKARFIPRTMSCRQAGKKSNHGLNYGETYVMFALINEIQERDGKQIVELYHSAYPGVRQGHKQIQSALAESRTLVNPFGNKRIFRDRWGDALFKAAYAHLPQSTVVDLVNDSMTQIHNDLSSYLHSYKFGAQVHDSILFQYPLSELENAARCIIRYKELLTRTIEYKGHAFHINVDAKVSAVSWGQLQDIKLEGYLVQNIQEAL